MIPLLLFLLTASDQKQWEQEILCWPDGPCRPRVVNLGTWEPRPAEKDWPESVYLEPRKADVP